MYGYSAGDYEVTASWNDMVFTQTLPNGNREFLLQNFPVYATQPLHFAIQVPNAPAYNSLNITALSGGMPLCWCARTCRRTNIITISA